MTRPRLGVTSVTIGAPDPRALAQLRPPEGETGFTLNFEFEAAYTPPVWPSVRGEQHITVHLDIQIEDLDAAVDWAISAGARLADYQPQAEVRVLFDPAGHPFCLSQ